MNIRSRRGASFIGEFMELFLGIVFALALVGVILTFSSTASSTSAAKGDTSGAQLYGLVGIFIAIVILAAVAGVAYREVSKFTHKGTRSIDTTPNQLKISSTEEYSQIAPFIQS